MLSDKLSFAISSISHYMHAIDMILSYFSTKFIGFQKKKRGIIFHSYRLNSSRLASRIHVTIVLICAADSTSVSSRCCSSKRLVFGTGVGNQFCLNKDTALSKLVPIKMDQDRSGKLHHNTWDSLASWDAIVFLSFFLLVNDYFSPSPPVLNHPDIVPT